MELPGRQNELIRRVVEANPKTIVVLNAGAPVCLPWQNEIPAILEAFYPGMEGGNAVARILLGEVNPSGKLPVTFPQRLEDTPADINSAYPGARDIYYREGIFVGYRYYDTKKVTPLFPFGHGLSYTKFEYSNLRLSKSAIRPDQTLTVKVDVTNIGKVTGKEIVARFHSKADADRALASFEARFRGGAMPDTMPEMTIETAGAGIAIANLAKQAGVVDSTSEALRLIDEMAACGIRVLIFSGGETPKPQASGNNFLYRLMGVDRVQVVPGGSDMMGAMVAMADKVRSQGGHPYLIPGGASNPLGALGYAACAQEILSQAFDMGLRIDRVVCASGSAGTHAGLLAGLWGTRSGIPVVGMNVSRTKAQQEELVFKLARETAALARIDGELPRDAVVCFGDYVGPGYSLPTAGMVEAVKLLARTEAVLLDPVYTGKAMAGLIDQVRKGFFKKGENVVFVHTGGSPALYAYLDCFWE